MIAGDEQIRPEAEVAPAVGTFATVEDHLAPEALLEPDRAAPARPRSSRLRALGRHLPLALTTVVLFGAWEIYVHASATRVLAAPSEIATAFWDLVTSGRLWDAAVPSLQLLVWGFGISAVIGTVLGLVLARLRLVDATLSPYLAGLYVTPDIALVPIIVVWFGYGFSGKLVIVVLSGVFPMLYNVTAGVRSAPVDLQDMARSFRAGRRTVLSAVVLPSALPFVFAGLKQSIGRCVIGMVVAEAYLQLGGLGSLVFYYGGRFAPDYLIASIVVLPMIGLALTSLVGVVERRVMSWRRS